MRLPSTQDSRRARADETAAGALGVQPCGAPPWPRRLRTHRRLPHGPPSRRPALPTQDVEPVAVRQLDQPPPPLKGQHRAARVGVHGNRVQQAWPAVWSGRCGPARRAHCVSEGKRPHCAPRTRGCIISYHLVKDLQAGPLLGRPDKCGSSKRPWSWAITMIGDLR
jgi:hypothetical protein